MSLEEEKEGIAGGTAAFAAVSAYFSYPLLRFMPGNLLAGAGCTLAICALVIWLAVHKAKVPRSFATIVLWIAAADVSFLFVMLIWAGRQSDINDVRCAHVQAEMLSPSPRRSDLPDVFVALGCRVQGDSDIQFPSKPG